MLKQRVITAIVLLLVLLPALFYTTHVPFCAIGVFCLILCLLAWYAGLLTQSLRLLWLFFGSVWVLAGAWLLKSGVAGWPRIPQVIRLAGGVLVLCLAWLAIAQARVIGINFLLSILVLVWVADIFAYFAGSPLASSLPRSALARAGKAFGVAWLVFWHWRSPGVGGMATGKPRFPAGMAGFSQKDGFCCCWPRCSWRP